ncbi:MAG: hypothetical protein C4576_27750 [Desulfobacteraceae bacterium]|nr:MAG: hypothetical protein C4576_27750 [Desulfobacteraceae bacterium]
MVFGDLSLSWIMNCEEMAMHEEGTRVRMTKGYRGAEGIITGRSRSRFGFYVVELENGIRIVVGSSAFDLIGR